MRAEPNLRIRRGCTLRNRQKEARPLTACLPWPARS